MDIQTWLRTPLILVALGSALGGMTRYALSNWLQRQAWTAGLPWATFGINVSGSFFLGCLAVLCLERVAVKRQELYLLLGTGFCGGFTTFSTFELEILQLLRAGRWGWASGYLFGSLATGLLGVVAGAMLGTWWSGRH